MRASVVHTRKYHARELKLKNSPTPQAIREILLVRNCSWLIHLITVLFFFSLFMPLPLPAFCEMRLCYKYYKFDARNRFIGSLQIFNMNVFSLLLKGELQSQLLWLFRQTEKCSEFRQKLLSVNERNFRVLPKSREKFWLEKFSPLNSVIGNR